MKLLPLPTHNEQAPAPILFDYFRDTFEANGFETGTDKRRSDSLDTPWLHLRSTYQGLEPNEISKRQIALDDHRVLMKILHTLPLGTAETVMPEPKERYSVYHPELSNATPLPYIKYTETEERTVMHKQLRKIRSEIPDINGMLGIERFSLFIKPFEYRAEITAEHCYFLPNERDLYELPRTNGAYPSRPTYPYLGPPERETTLAFMDRQPLISPEQNTLVFQRLGHLLLNAGL